MNEKLKEKRVDYLYLINSFFFSTSNYLVEIKLRIFYNFLKSLGVNICIL